MPNSKSIATPAEVGAKYIRWGLGLFIFGLIIGYGPWLRYMHGAMEEVRPAFLHNVNDRWVALDRDGRDKRDCPSSRFAEFVRNPLEKSATLTIRFWP